MQNESKPTYTWHIENLTKNVIDAIREHFGELLQEREVILEDSEALFDRFIKLGEMRIAFIEKVILLDTGTFALSLTFLASVGSHSAARSVSGPFLHTVIAGWLFLSFSILLGSVHNRLRMSSIDSAFLMNAARRREYRMEDRARRFGRTSTFLTGTITPNQGDEEPLDLGAMFKTFNEYLQAEYKKAVESAREQQQNAQALLQKQTKKAVRIESGTILFTLIALLLLGAAAVQIAWVFFQK